MTQQPYTGPAGRTRMEGVRVFRTDREPVEVEVFRVLNVGEFPELREAALSGTLHRLDDGEVVDVPFVYHDPDAEDFVLVIPHGARGRELSERAKLLDSLMREYDEDVPEYVRHFAIAYGPRGLARHVDDRDAMEVDLTELEPVDGPPVVASYYPRLAGLLPPADFWDRASAELAPLIDDDQLWVFARVSHEERGAFAEASCDLLVQLKTIDQLPVCILALTDRTTNAVRRAYLNPVRSGDGRVLELLRRDFHAKVVIYSEDRELLRSFRVEAPRAANAKMVIGRAERAPFAMPERWAEAVDACRSTPTSVDRTDHPFVLGDDAKNAADALRRLRHLEAWSTPERIEEALLVLSVPRTVFELSRRQVVSDALRFGLAMSNTLLLQAVRFGLAADARSLVAALRLGFDQIVPEAFTQGLDEAQIQANRESLDRLSRLHGTSTVHQLSCTVEHSG